MKWGLIQISEPYLSIPNVTSPCFRLWSVFETLEDAIEERKATKNEDWFIIIQIW